jgi:transposase
MMPREATAKSIPWAYSCKAEDCVYDDATGLQRGMGVRLASLSDMRVNIITTFPKSIVRTDFDKKSQFPLRCV